MMSYSARSDRAKNGSIAVVIWLLRGYFCLSHSNSPVCDGKEDCSAAGMKKQARWKRFQTPQVAIVVASPGFWQVDSKDFGDLFSPFCLPRVVWAIAPWSNDLWLRGIVIVTAGWSTRWGIDRYVLVHRQRSQLSVISNLSLGVVCPLTAIASAC